MTKRGADPIAVLEAAYLLEQDPQSWLDRLVGAACPLLDRGLGLFAYEYDLRDPATFIPGARSLAGVEDDITAGAEALSFSVPAELNRVMYPLAPWFGTASERLGHALSKLPQAEALIRAGMSDAIMAIGGCGDGRGLMLGAVLPSEQQPVSRLRATWLLITVHLAAAYRLRCALLDRDSFDPVPGAAAILDPAGKVQHAVGRAKGREARESLREAAVRIDRARGALRHDDADQALALWRALVDGRWSLVDHFDSDGRRFVIATKNAPRVSRPLCLTPRERQVAVLAAAGHANKLIAYDLGIAEGTVATTLARAMQKLGVRSRTQLAMLAEEPA